MASLGASTYNFIATQSLGSATNTVTFSNIPQGYTDLVIIANVQVSGASGSKIQFNGDVGANYSYTDILSYASTAGSGKNTSTSSIYNNFVYGESITSGVYSPYEIHIPSYANTNMYKTMLWKYGSNTTNSNSGEYGFITGLWRSYNPITSITISCWNAVNYAVGTSFTLYGIKAADVASITPTKAIGGDIIASDGTYTYHAFKSSGTFTPAQALSCDVLVLAGGGGGGSQYYSGGGGAGGIQAFSSQALTAGTAQTVTVGAGGVGGGGAGPGFSGANSVFGALTASVGGGFGNNYSMPSGYPAGNGGSGGGGGGDGGSGSGIAMGGGSATSGQGNAGGSGYATTGGFASGGGGGGAGGAGASGSSGNGGAGGVGINTVSWSGGTLATALATLSLGVNGYIAGGGGGSAASAGTAGGTATAGGGAGGKNANGISAVAYTGGGGGGGGASGTVGGNGGSGLVIVRYLS